MSYSPRPWHSLRLRLPLFTSALVAVLFLAVFGVVNREIERMLLRAGRDRAQGAAEQISGLTSQGTTRGINEMRRAASDAAVQQYLANPASDAAAARTVLTPLAVATQPAVELWSAAGSRVLTVEPARGAPAPLEATVPLRPGLTPFQVVNGTVFYAMVEEVLSPRDSRPDQSRTTPAPAGYLVVRRTLSAPQASDILNRLVGGGALVAMGDPTAGVWTNFSTTVPAPPITLTPGSGAEYRTARGERRVGALSPITGTPWVVWIEFPRDAILAPAQTLRSRLSLIGLSAVGIAAILLSVLSARMTSPLHELTVATEAVALGDGARRVQADRSDEIGRLAEAFNGMVERVQAAHQELEARVRERTAELDRFFSLSLDFLCIAGMDGQFRRVNPAWEEMLGWSPSELTGRPYLDFVHPDDREATTREASTLATGATTARFENRYRAKDGSYRWLSWKAAPAPEQGLLYAAARDVTEEKRLAAARDQHVAELKIINDELESFSYSVSHDLRAPLRHIVGFAALLEKSAKAQLRDEDRRYLTTITDAATRMGRLIDDLLSFSRMGRTPLDRRPVNLDAIVRDVAEEVGRGARPDITWELHPLPTVAGDPNMLRLVFVNLLSNAAKYSSRATHPVIEVTANGTGDQETVIVVRDNGVGFDETYADKLFGVFQRLHSSDEFEGTGIGLANVRRIVHRHGGRVWATSVVNSGATFYVALPNRRAA